MIYKKKIFKIPKFQGLNCGVQIQFSELKLSPVQYMCGCWWHLHLQWKRIEDIGDLYGKEINSQFNDLAVSFLAPEQLNFYLFEIGGTQL